MYQKSLIKTKEGGKHMALTLEEQEVHVSFGRLDDRASIYVSDTRYINKLNKLAEKSDEWKIEHEERLKSTGELLGVTYSCPINLISFRTKTQRVELTDEQRAVRSERMKQILHGRN
jgi:hypothetical protein